MLSVQGLTKRFWGKLAVDEVTCDFALGRTTGLIGPNGAGKTTVFNMISGLIRPTAGKVFFEGRDITGLAPHKVAQRGLGRGFQRTRLFLALTALDNVVVALPEVSHQILRPQAYSLTHRKRLEERAQESLQQLKIGHLGSRRASELSYGDQRAVMLACLLATGAKTLLLDEPTGGIDPTARERILDHIRSLSSAGRTIVLVEHNLDVVRGACQTVFFLAEGRLIATGTPDEIQSDMSLKRLYFGTSHA